MGVARDFFASKEGEVVWEDWGEGVDFLKASKKEAIFTY